MDMEEYSDLDLVDDVVDPCPVSPHGRHNWDGPLNPTSFDPQYWDIPMCTFCGMSPGENVEGDYEEGWEL